MHVLLVQVKNHLIEIGIARVEHFATYESIQVKPVHVHRPKGDHKKAIYTLAQELAAFAGEGKDRLSDPILTSQRFASMTTGRRKPVAKL